MRRAAARRASTGGSAAPRRPRKSRSAQGRSPAARARAKAPPAARDPGGALPERHTPSGIPVEPVYSPADLPRDLARRTPPPGVPPYIRGIHPGMYRARPWTMRQYAGFGSAHQTNQRFRYLLEQGQTGLSVAFDLPTQMGLDSDAPLARGEVGRTGVAISCLADMEELLDSLPLDQVTTSMTINATAPLLLALYVAVADGRGIARGKDRKSVV